MSKGHESLFSIDHLVPLNDGFVEFNHERGSIMPVGADFRWEIAAIQNGFDHARDECRGVQTALNEEDGSDEINGDYVSSHRRSQFMLTVRHAPLHKCIYTHDL